MQLLEQQNNPQVKSGRWVTDREFSQKTSISRAVLSNWRWRDRLAGRTQAQPGYPVYKRFGRAVRYWLEAA